MHDTKDEERGRQDQTSRQSGAQGGQSGTGSDKAKKPMTRSSGIGSSQGQDKASRERGVSDRPSAGTADIERSETGVETNSGNPDSLVNESTGAFKERP